MTGCSNHEMLPQAYLDDVNKYYGEHMTYEGDSDQDLVTSWDHMWWAANVLLAEATDQGTFHQATQVCVGQRHLLQL